MPPAGRRAPGSVCWLSSPPGISWRADDSSSLIRRELAQTFSLAKGCPSLLLCLPSWVWSPCLCTGPGRRPTLCFSTGSLGVKYAEDSTQRDFHGKKSSIIKSSKLIPKNVIIFGWKNLDDFLIVWKFWKFPKFPNCRVFKMRLASFSCYTPY